MDTRRRWAIATGKGGYGCENVNRHLSWIKLFRVAGKKYYNAQFRDMLPKSLWIVRVLVVILAGFCTFYLGTELVQILSSHNSKELAVRSLRQKDYSQFLEKGSAAFFALPNIKQKLIASVRSANEQLMKALSDTSTVRNTLAPDNVASFPTSGSSAVRRAVLAFLPPNNSKFNSELKWFFLSWGYMRSKESSNMKTDLILFTEPSYVEKLASDFGCNREVRKSFQDSAACIVLPHVPLSKRKIPENEDPSPLLDYSHYVDSMLILSEFQHTAAYDILIRSDLDTFLTPGFSEWTLKGDVAIVTGRGGYSSENSSRRLTWIAEKKLGLKDSGRRNLGSTWYGKASVMVATAKLTVAVMDWLDTQEFSDYEKGNNGIDGWPYWHWPVILLYGGHIALNQIPSNHILEYKEGEVEMDKATSATNAMGLGTKHLHCFHGEGFFAKFKFYAGEYKDMDVTKYAAMDTPQAYAAVIAMSSDRMSIAELVEYVNSKEDMTTGAWKRLTVESSTS